MLGPSRWSAAQERWEIAFSSAGDSAAAFGISRSMRNFGIGFSGRWAVGGWKERSLRVGARHPRIPAGVQAARVVLPDPDVKGPQVERVQDEVLTEEPGRVVVVPFALRDHVLHGDQAELPVGFRLVQQGLGGRHVLGAMK